MLKAGDICELNDGVSPTINREGEPIRLLLDGFIVGEVDLYRGIIVAHRMGVKVEMPSEVSSYYHVVGSMGEYPEKKLNEKLDKIRARWINQLGDRIAEDCEVHELIARTNEAMTELIPPALGVYYYRFSGVYMDDKKRSPMVRLKWTPPTPGQPTERSHHEDNKIEPEAEGEHTQSEPGTVGPEAGHSEAGPEGQEGRPRVHDTHEAGGPATPGDGAEETPQGEGSERPDGEEAGRGTGQGMASP